MRNEQEHDDFSGFKIIQRLDLESVISWRLLAAKKYLQYFCAINAYQKQKGFNGLRRKQVTFMKDSVLW